jgi:hypothetical protein
LNDNLDFSKIQINDEHEESKLFGKILNEMNCTSTDIHGISQEYEQKVCFDTKNNLLDNTMLMPRDDSFKAVGDETMIDTKKRLKFDSKESSIESNRSRKILKQRRSSSNRKYESSNSRSYSRSRKKRTRSRTSRYEKSELMCDCTRTSDRRDYYQSEQIIIFDVPIKFDRDMDFNKHLYSLFPEIRLMNFSHDQFKQGFMIGRMIDEPDIIKRFYDRFVSTKSYYKDYQFVITKHDRSSRTPMMKFSYKVVKYRDVVSLD